MKNQYNNPNNFYYNQEINKIAEDIEKIIENSKKEQELISQQKTRAREQQEQKHKEKLIEKEEQKKLQQAIDERQNSWLETRKKQMESQKPTSKEATPSPAKIASSSNSSSNNIKEEILKLRKEVEIIKQKNKEEKNAEKLKKLAEENQKLLKLKEKTQPISTIENVDYYYQLRMPKQDEIKNYQQHTISSDPKQTAITKIKIEELNLQTNHKLDKRNHPDNKENHYIENKLKIEIKPTEKNIKSCLKNSLLNDENKASNSKNFDKKILSFKNQLENSIKIHHKNLSNAKIAYDKHPLTKLQNKNGTTNKIVEKPLNKISTPKIKYTDILKTFAKELKKENYQMFCR